MLFNFASIASVIALTLPLTSVVANPVPTVLEGASAELEERGNWHYPKTHRVTVGAWGELKYDPEYVKAKVGDYVEFELYVRPTSPSLGLKLLDSHPKNHTVTESSFYEPCTRIDGGFRTGL